jgi:hypothetical protein
MRLSPYLPEYLLEYSILQGNAQMKRPHPHPLSRGERGVVGSDRLRITRNRVPQGDDIA